MNLPMKKILLAGSAAMGLTLAVPAFAATTTVNGNGPINGGTGTDAPDAVTAATPGVQFSNTAPAIHVTNTGDVLGGAGFDAGSMGTVGQAGTGGAIGLDFNNDNGTGNAFANETAFTNTQAANILGGNGGNGASGVFMAGTTGGNGGNGGAGISASANFGDLDTGNFGFERINGGGGGRGGQGGGMSNDGGNGGNGGIGLNVTGSNFVSQVDQVYGGDGSDGGDSSSAGTGVGGMGGDGGAGVSLNGAGNPLTIYAYIQGGSGGNGGATTAGTGGMAAPAVPVLSQVPATHRF